MNRVNGMLLVCQIIIGFLLLSCFASGCASDSDSRSLSGREKRDRQDTDRQDTDRQDMDRQDVDCQDVSELLSAEDEILILAQRAASSHNSQPWSLIRDAEGVYTVLADHGRWLREVDPDKREFLISLGAYLENLRIAAGSYGCRAEIRILMKERDDRELASFRLVPGEGPRDEEMIRLMRSSSMAKVRYGRSLEKGRALFSILEGREELIWIDRRDDVFSWILEGTVTANRVQAWNDRRQRELADYICFSREDEKRGVGMTPKMLNLPWFMSTRWYGRAGEETIMSKMFRNGTASKAEKLMKNSAGLILVTSTDDSAASLLECGMRFQSLYWECKAAGIELHTVSQILEESPWMDEIDGNIREILDNQEEAGANSSVQLVLRAGTVRRSTADALSSASVRMPLEDIVKRSRRDAEL